MSQKNTLSPNYGLKTCVSQSEEHSHMLEKSSERNPHNKHMKTQTFLWCRCLLPFFPGRQLPAPTKSSWVITLLNRAMATLNRFTVKTRSLLNNFRPCFSEWSKVLKLIPFCFFLFFLRCLFYKIFSCVSSRKWRNWGMKLYLFKECLSFF